MGFFSLLFPWGIVLQALAIVHFIRRRPDTIWLWVIIFLGPLGALVYIMMEIVPDLGLLRQSYDALGKRRRIRQLEAVVLENPAAGNYEELADLYLDEREYAKARDAYDKAITGRGDQSDAIYRRGVANVHLGDYAAALPDLEYVTAREPKYDLHRAIGLLAHAYANTDQPERADALFRHATEMSTRSETYFNYAVFLASQNRKAEAREWALRILAKKPTMPRYLQRRERPWFRKASALLKHLPALLFLLASATAAHAQRLPPGVVPDHYTLWFAPDFRTDTFRGRATIRVRIEKPTTRVTLHAAEIRFDEARITAAGRTQVMEVALDPKQETAILTVARQLPAGTATIDVAFAGVLNDKLRGFYLSKANDRKYAVSQMEATDARRAFPCFDEPHYKATFEISLTVDRADTAISNGAQISDTPGPEPGKHTITFQTTKRMSTYLVALLVGDFVCREGSSDGIPVRVCSTPDKSALTAFALEAAVHQVEFYNRYYGIRYPFGKLDIIAVPDFAASAMENTGAITFREQYLLADPARASLETRKNIASILSHEIAHQWFGNLVTMKWWDDIWLNEGFATWMANKPLASWRPDWRMELDDAMATQQALLLDALPSTRAIRTRVATPDEINQVFDAIAYEKSAGVLRMAENYVGNDVFRGAVAAYLNKYAYSNATAEDFWNEVARASGKPIDRIMASYVDQPGAPVLRVTSECKGATTDVRINQERFIGAVGIAPPEQKWAVPVCFKAFPDSPAKCELVVDRNQTISLPGCAADAYVNAGSSGYYFTQYPPQTVRALSRRARGTLTPAERIALLGDEWWMARAGRHDIGVFLDLAAALSGDDTPAIASHVAEHLSYVAEYIVPDALQPRFQEWVRGRFGRILQQLGVPGKGADDGKMSRQAALLNLVGIGGSSGDVQKQARDLADRYITDPSAFPGTIVPAVLRVAAYGGDAALYRQYRDRLRALSSQPEEYYWYFQALPYFRDPQLVAETLAFAVSPDVRSQDAATLIGALLARPWARNAAWAHVTANWSKLIDRLGVFQGIPSIVEAARNFCSSTDAAAVKRFFEANAVAAVDRGVRQAIEHIESCAAFAARQTPPLAQWLSAQSADR